MEMPKASFDTSGSDTHSLSYESGLLTIGVRSGCAHDSLENRLASTASRLLIGILTSNVSVNFVVTQSDEAHVLEAEAEEFVQNEAEGPRAAIPPSIRAMSLKHLWSAQAIASLTRPAWRSPKSRSAHITRILSAGKWRWANAPWLIKLEMPAIYTV